MVIDTYAEIGEICESLREEGKTIVSTNGAFDIIHIGHKRFLEKVKKYGDVLVVAVNSDKSVKMYKGPNRPLVREELRIELLDAFECVDYTVMFNEREPSEVLGYVKPNVHCKGEDYTMEQILEKDAVEEHGGVVKLLSWSDDEEKITTTHLIDDIMRSREVISVQSLCEKIVVDDDHDWGYQLRCINEPGYCAKLMVLENNNAGSVHYHKEKKETFVVLSGSVQILVSQEKEVPLERLQLDIGDSITFLRGQPHQMFAIEAPAVLLEASTHDWDIDTYRIKESKEDG